MQLQDDDGARLPTETSAFTAPDATSAALGRLSPFPAPAPPTFGAFAERRIEQMAPRWERSQTRPSWENSVRRWAAPIYETPRRWWRSIRCSPVSRKNGA